MIADGFKGAGCSSDSESLTIAWTCHRRKNGKILVDGMVDGIWGKKINNNYRQV